VSGEIDAFLARGAYNKAYMSDVPPELVSGAFFSSKKTDRDRSGGAGHAHGWTKRVVKQKRARAVAPKGRAHKSPCLPQVLATGAHDSYEIHHFYINA
jgi:hypothetical protein